LAVGTLLALAHLTVYAGVRIYVHQWLDHNVRTVAATEAASSTDGTGDVHLHEGHFAQLDSGAFTEKFVQIFDRRGQLVLQSTRLRGEPPVISRAAIEETFAGRPPILTTTVQGRVGRVTALTASRDGRPYAIAVGLFSDEIEHGLARLGWLLAGVWMLCLGASAGIAHVLASRALAPIAQIAARAAWIAQGHFDTRLDMPAVHDEVGRMTMVLNSMLDRLQGAVEANRRFASDASHELRGPLTAIAGEVDVTLRHPRSAERYEETLRHVRSRLGALTRLAEDLILLVRAQEGAGEIVRREVPLQALVDDAFGRLGGEAMARGVTLEREGLAGVLIYADPGLMARVIDNVIANAVQYNRDHGRVHVSARVEEPAAEAWESPIVEIHVHDTGPGIPADQHERIFERFYRLDQSRARHTGGSGLGLAICREVLSLHGGTIRVQSSSPAGTVIAISLAGRAGVVNADSVPRGHSAGRQTIAALR
jgi:signal transduction histidine kinase